MEQASIHHSSYQQQLRDDARARRARMGMRATTAPPVVTIKPLPPPSCPVREVAAIERADHIREREKRAPKPIPSARELIHDQLAGRITSRKIVTIVARAHGLTTDEICLHDRKLNIADAKTHLVDVMVRETSLSHLAIGEFLDLNHSVITHHRKRFQQREKFLAGRIRVVNEALDLLGMRSAPMGQGQTDQLALELVPA